VKTFAGARRTSATISRDAHTGFPERTLRNKSSALAVYDADSTGGITHTSEGPTAMFTTFHGRTNSWIWSFVKNPLVAIWAVVAIAGVVFIMLGIAHPTGSETAVAKAMTDARKSSHSRN